MTHENPSNRFLRPIRGLRWWIGGLLFASTAINYVDRQTLSVLAPHLKGEYQWNNQDFALIVISFRFAYAVGQTVTGRLIDCIGTRQGLTLTVAWYSMVAMLTPLASGLKSFCLFRFLLGVGESANWPGATKAVSEWFPSSERGWAVALFDSGSSIGGAVAPVMVLWLYSHFGGWRPAFVVTGTLGFLWLIAWWGLYYPPKQHPQIGPEERQLILAGKAEAKIDRVGSSSGSWTDLLKLPETWGIILGRSLMDPVFFFFADWLAVYLAAKGVNLETSLLVLWVPFVGADLGNFVSGGASSWLIQRGWPISRARTVVIILSGGGISTIFFTIFTSNVHLLTALFAVSTFGYAAWITMVLVLPSDLYDSKSVATVSGMSGTGCGIGTILSTYLIGRISDRYSFGPVLIAASAVPIIATGLLLLLVYGTPVRALSFYRSGGRNA